MFKITKPRTALKLNEGTTIFVYEHPNEVDEGVEVAQETESNYRWFTQVLWFGFRTRCVRVNVKRILFYYPMFDGEL